MKTHAVKVLVVEGSSNMQMLLLGILHCDSEIQVVGLAKNGQEAFECLARTAPDVILMDMDMPEIDALEITRRIMESRPVPIVICSGHTNVREAITTFRLMEAGAVACVEKPTRGASDDFQETTSRLLRTLKSMSEVKVVRRWPRPCDAMLPEGTSSSRSRQTLASVGLIGVGASTGGPPVIQSILTGLPNHFPVPVLIVQHIAPGFLGGLVEWLDQTTGLKCQVAEHGMQPLPGQVYLAPDDFHMTVRTGGRIALTRAEPENGLRPSVGQLFRSMAQVYGRSATGVLLTGMGKDGAEELKEMKDRGATTIVQDKESSIVHGMPGEAIKLGAATYVLSAGKIADALIALVNQIPAPQGARS
jgi:two-component system chemotaxis response regulator CheB